MRLSGDIIKQVREMPNRFAIRPGMRYTPLNRVSADDLASALPARADDIHLRLMIPTAFRARGRF